MILHDEVARQMESEGGIFNGDKAAEAMEIEKVLNRAHEIHRAHGGLFGYDLEDWLQAERELYERNQPKHSRRKETA